MGKWIRERMRRRRKKTDSKTSQGESLPPLQPDFLTSEERSRAPEPEAKQEQAEEAAPVPPAADTAAATEPAPGRAEGQRAPGKRRRRRGRRGRGGRGPAAATTQGTPLQPAYPEPAEAAHLPEATPAAQPRKLAPPHPQHAATSAQPRHPKGVVILAIGLPGSGKSTWFKRRDAVPLSSDVIRSMLFDDVTEQRFQDLVFSTLRSLLRARLVARMPLNYVDATNLSPHDRRGWIKMAHDFGYEVQAVISMCPRRCAWSGMRAATGWSPKK
ncbi:MAG TPA: ATP-binding protein [Terriglobales bacterium]|nr:ATP-binding protein [Terriglobales bacterium]